MLGFILKNNHSCLYFIINIQYIIKYITFNLLIYVYVVIAQYCEKNSFNEYFANMYLKFKYLNEGKSKILRFKLKKYYIY